ncbi:MAG: hypothetical protein K2J78_11490, partial [Muribaculaceae bacterium]|nr:hypothetical protein [Muribaculaceae bacterium]
VSTPHNDTTDAPSSAETLDNKKKERLKYRDFLMETIKKIGCQAFISEHDNNVYLKYQGEAFCIVQDRSFIRIWDLPYFEVNVLDTNLPLIIESINSANFGIGPTIVISKPDKNGIREIQSKMDMIFLPELPNPDKYLAKIFDLFFDLKISLQTEIAKWNNPEAQNQPSSLTSSFPYQN